MTLAVRTAGLGKEYRIFEGEAGPRRSSYRSLRETLGAGVFRPLRRLGGREGSPRRSSFWALRDVDIDIPAGQAVSIIGANGAGKTTLLKILSRITFPSAGVAEVRGRVGPLLEVGTGFHPELTGRENVYLNGAILGMSRSDIERRFDKIVAFAEVERFLDVPVKHYSSGMYLRLGFSVAAHLDPDILIVDEVLAVGDASFQRKCLGLMGEDARRGHTVLFVTHNLAAAKLLTGRCIWLDRGRVVLDGPTSEVAERYLRHAGEVVEGMAGTFDLRPAHLRESVGATMYGDMCLTGLRFLGDDGEARGRFGEREPLTIEIAFDVVRPVSTLELLLWVSNREGVRVFSAMSGQRSVDLSRGPYRMRCRIDPDPLVAGSFEVTAGLLTHVWQDQVPTAGTFEIVADPTPDDDVRYARGQGHDVLGVVRVASRWAGPDAATKP
jgi:lipopolysaccharide transport system ATP-binding protein